MHYFGLSTFEHSTAEKTGVLLLNLGSPDAPTPEALRRYLGEFLWDRRVVELPRWLWWMILHGPILRWRPRRSAALYKRVWTENGSPLVEMTGRQTEQLSRLLKVHDDSIVVAYAMTYGRPKIRDVLRDLAMQGIGKLVVLPLFPQYSATSTGAALDAVARELMTWRWMPELRWITHYHHLPGYLDALACSIRESRVLRPPAQRLLFSFHGIPQAYFLAGDPYYCQCLATARQVAERLGLADAEWAVSFQSRVGRQPWLQPYTDQLLHSWAHEGVTSVDVVCPGFAADCLETLEEIQQQNCELFLHAGGQQFHYIPALNDRPDHLQVLCDLIYKTAPDWFAGVEDNARLEMREARAQAQGRRP